MYKNEIGTLPNTIHKNKLKMDQRLNYKARHYKTLRIKHKQNILWHKLQQDLFWSTSKIVVPPLNRGWLFVTCLCNFPGKDTGVGCHFLLQGLPRVMKIKTKINKLYLIKIKSFCTAKETINKMKKITLRMGENISKVTDKGLISKIYKQRMQLNIKEINKPNQNMSRRSK